MSHLSISLLGGMTISLNGQSVTGFGYDKVKALLGYLVVEADRPHHRETLAGLLWPDQSQKAATDSLRNALSKLRQAICDREADPPYLFISKEEIQFNTQSDHWLDVKRFSQLLEECRTHRHRRIECCVSCTDRLTQAAALYHGEFLQGFSLADSDLFEDWARIQREEYLELAMNAFQQLASTYEWRGEYDQALEYTQHLLKLDPCDEEAHVQAIRLFGLLGKRAEACEQYKKCRKQLADELEVEPTDETTRLYEQIKYGMFQVSPNRLRINNLPPDLTSFVGRGREMEEINLLLEDPNCRLLTLVGPGGVGKTRLAIAVAAQQMEAFPNGACFVPLAGVSSVESIVPSILQALDLKQAEQGDLNQQLVDFLHDKELILILDNFEHLVDGAGLVSELLEQAPGLIILVSSRQRLGLQAEWAFEVNGLSYPTGKDTQNLAAYEAVMLFQQRLHQVKPRSTLFQDDLSAVSRICQAVEGLPLGVELAASAVRRRSIEQVASAIESGKEDLKVAYKDVPERHRSIRAVFEHSYRLLSQEEQSAFVGLAVFRGGFSAEAAEQVAGANAEILESLVEHSLVRYDGEKERYDLHELVRQYALEKLREQGREDEIRNQHLRYFIDLGERIYNKTYTNERFNTFAPEVDNYRAAMEWCTSNQMWESSLQLFGAVGETWALTSNWHEVDRWDKKIFASKHEFEHGPYLARGLKSAGAMVGDVDWDAALVLINKSLSIWREIGDQNGIAKTLYAIGDGYLCQGKTREAIMLMEESLVISRQINNQVLTADVLRYLCGLYLHIDFKNNLEKARKLRTESLKIYRQIGSDAGIAFCLASEGCQEMAFGNYKKAHSLLEESINLLRNSNYPTSYQISILGNLGAVCGYLRDYKSACTYYEKSIEYANQIGDRNLVSLCDLCYILSRTGEVDRALFILREIYLTLEVDHDIAIAVQGGNLRTLPWVLMVCGEPESGARLYGFNNSLPEKLNIPPSTFPDPDYEIDLVETRQRIGEVEFNTLWEEGRNMTHEQARKCVMEARVRVAAESRVEYPI